MGQAKQELRDWDAEITARLKRLRALGTGAGPELICREALGLAGAWYGWFMAHPVSAKPQREGQAVS